MSAVRRLFSGAPVAVVDSAVSSASNFLLSGAALALLDAGEFAAVSLVQAAHVILLALNRSGYFEALLIRRSNKTTDSADFDGSAALTASTASAFVVGVGVLIVGLVVGSTLIVVFAVGLVPLAIADSMRFLAFAEQQPERALRVDAVWLITQVALLVAMVVFDVASGAAILATWCIGALIGSVAGVSSVAWSTLAAFRSWIGTDADIRLGLVIDAIAARAAPAVALFLIAAVLPVEEVALVSGPRSIFGPINILFTAAMSVGLAAAARHDSMAGLRRLLGRIGAAMSAVVIVLGVFYVSISGVLSDLLSGLDPDQLNLRLLLTAGALFAVAWSTVFGVAHRSQENIANAARLQLIAGLLLIVGTVTGAVLGGAVGALIGQLVSRWLAVGSWALGSRGLQLKGDADVAIA